MRCSSLTITFLLLSMFAASAPGQQAGPDSAGEIGLRRDLPAPAGDPREGSELEMLTEEVSEQLRCPMCQGMSVADSPSASAQAIKDEVRSLLAAGFSEDQVKQYFEGTYGEFVLLSPKREGLNWLLWLAPGAVFLGGFIWIAVTRRSRSASAAAPDDEDLDPYLERVRQLANGDPTSQRPQS